MNERPANLLSWGTAKALLRKSTDPRRFAVSKDSLIEQSSSAGDDNRSPVLELISDFSVRAPYIISTAVDTADSESLVFDEPSEDEITTVEFVEEAPVEARPSQAEIESENDEQVATLDKIAKAYEIEQKHAECEEVYKRIVALRKIALGQDHEKVAVVLNSLGWFYYHQHDLEKAESILRSAASIIANSQTAGVKLSAGIKNHLAEICRSNRNYEEAERLAHESLRLRQSSTPMDEQEVAQSLSTLGKLYCDEGKLAPAEQYFKRALAIQERSLDPTDPELATTLEDYAAVLRKMGRRNCEAKDMEARARHIRQLNEFRERKSRLGHHG